MGEETTLGQSPTLKTLSKNQFGEQLHSEVIPCEGGTHAIEGPTRACLYGYVRTHVRTYVRTYVYQIVYRENTLCSSARSHHTHRAWELLYVRANLNIAPLALRQHVATSGATAIALGFFKTMRRLRRGRLPRPTYVRTYVPTLQPQPAEQVRTYVRTYVFQCFCFRPAWSRSNLAHFSSTYVFGGHHACHTNLEPSPRNGHLSYRR